MGSNCSSSSTGTSPSKEKAGEVDGANTSEISDTKRDKADKDKINEEMNKLAEGGSAAIETGSYPRPTTHRKCVNDLYPRTEDIRRFPVPEERVSWEVEYPEYQPVDFQAVQEVPIPEDDDFRKIRADVAWNKKDSPVNRASHQGPYEIVDGVPRNPVGRTGVCGRGRLARWGPNHAADPIVTRWKRNEAGQIETDFETKKPILQFVAIIRGDSGEWAIPGGFVDSGEEVSDALKREFCEEAMDSGTATEEEKLAMRRKMSQLFSSAREVYRGYVDDPRNTDNAWMETVAVNIHDEEGAAVGNLNLNAGDDAVGVKWRDISSDLQLYASHACFVRQVVEIHQAHW